MPHGIWDLFLRILGREQDDDDVSDAHRFVPSPLDLSVRIGHGGSDDEVERELSNIQEQARELEERQREQ